MKILKFSSLTLLYLIMILSTESLLLMLTTGITINTIVFPIFNNIDFLVLLIKNNPWSGFLELVAQPVLIIGKSHTAPGEYLSALYYYPFNSLLHILLAALIASRVLYAPKQILRPAFIIASLMLLLAINYVWLAACCGAIPGWTLDTVLVYYALSENVNVVSRMNVYDAIHDWMGLLQLLILAVSVIILWRVTAKRS